MSSLLDQLRARHGMAPAIGADTMSANGRDLSQRMNYATCGNIVELTTEVIHKLVRKNIGMSDAIGEERLLKRDIAALVGSRLTKRVEAANRNRG